MIKNKKFALIRKKKREEKREKITLQLATCIQHKKSIKMVMNINLQSNDNGQ